MKFKAIKTSIDVPVEGETPFVYWTLMYKRHWWNKWRYVMDGFQPRWFYTKEDCVSFSKKVK